MSKVQPASSHHAGEMAPPRTTTPGRLPPLTHAGARPRNELCIQPVATSSELLPLYPEPAHEIVDAGLTETAPAESRQLVAVRKELAELQANEEIFSTWAALPIAVWGGLTLAGCVYHFHFVTAALMGLLTAAGCILPFFDRRRFLRVGVGVSIFFSLLGWTLLEHVGGIFTVGARRVLGWLAAAEQAERSGAATTAVPLNLAPTVDHILAAVVIGLAAALTLGSWIQALRFALQERRKRDLQGQLAAATGLLKPPAASRPPVRTKPG